MSELSITHTHEAGTLIDGTSGGDASVAILKANRWRWGRTIGAWFIPQSRDRFAKIHTINTTARQLRELGYTVTIDIDDNPRPVAQAEADKAAQLTARAEALANKAQRRTAQAEAAWQANTAAFNSLPEGGEPIKIGHHSERRHRAAIDRADRTMGRAVAAHEDAKEAEGRARIAAAANDRRNNPTTIGNRIAKLEADIRRWQRRLDDIDGRRTEDNADRWDATHHRLTQLLARDSDAVTYWQAVRAAQIEAGTIGNYSAATIKPGDAVADRRGDWARVVKVNAKSVTINGPFGTYRLNFHELSGHRPTTTHAA
ncbi:DUF3560 domain-containing protein [Demequina lutea]|uniref:DUF3560 domain-containing protein n=1 Tax=Demequina lutea TaxID=431489 RepID=A0A7Z0CLG6_9MICO|nr:DUF3560 domain-containing protein [Demequina lutea]NYI42913.1 hypothetical protein [Demequina lutea]